MNLQSAIEKKRLSPKVQTLAALIALATAVALPQAVHLLGAALGLGTSLGEALLPMHLPILLVGFLAGPYAGAAAGLLSPLVSFWLTSMPGKAMLPFMMIELCAYGLITGLFRNGRLPMIPKLLIAQVGGRAVRGLAIVISYYLAGNYVIAPSVILTSVADGWIGLLLQILLIPLILRTVEHLNRHE